MAGPLKPYKDLSTLTDQATRRGLRRRLQARRNAIDSSARAVLQHRAQQRLRRLPCFRRARHIGIYHAIGAEIDPAGVPRLPGQHFYLPILIGERMRFASDHSPRMRRGRFGIPEPIQSHRRPAFTLDLVVVPLLGFDADCNRMGMGGGFYDRCFARRLTGKHGAPRLVGLAFDCQQLQTLPVAPWDVPLDLVVTPTRVHRRLVDQSAR